MCVPVVELVTTPLALAGAVLAHDVGADRSLTPHNKRRGDEPEVAFVEMSFFPLLTRAVRTQFQEDPTMNNSRKSRAHRSEPETLTTLYQPMTIDLRPAPQSPLALFPAWSFGAQLTEPTVARHAGVDRLQNPDRHRAPSVVIVTTEEELRAIVRSEFEAAMVPSIEQEDSMTAAQVGALLGYKTAHVAELVRRRGLPSHQPSGRGGRHMFRRAEVEAWATQRSGRR